MAVRIGKVCIEGVDSTEELKKHGIYYLGKDLDEVIKNKIPLDYEFLVIDGSKECLFIKAIQCLFNNNWAENSDKLKTTIKDEIPVHLYDEINCGETTFTWMSRVIEKFPGRIIIVGDKEGELKNKPSNWELDNEDITTWIRKRIIWIPSIEKVKIEIKEGSSDVYQALFEKENPWELTPKKLILSLYDNWIKNYTHEKNIEVNLNFKGEESSKITKDFIEKNIWEMKYKALNIIDEKDDYKFFLPFYCPGNSMPGNNNWAVNFKEYRRITQGNLKDQKIQRLEILEKQYIDLCSCLIDDKPAKDNFKKILKDIFVGKVRNGFSNAPSIFKADLQEPSKKYNFCIRQNNNREKLALKYSRHESVNPKDDHFSYQESLTGASVHFNLLYSTFSRYDEEQKAEMYFSLVENGVVRFLIADERITNYVSKNEQIKTIFNCAGVTIIEEIDEILKNGIIDFFKTINIKELKGKVEARYFDIFIIHQGIIDKMSVGLKGIEEVINQLKKNYFSFVVVTSGRGTPSNIPLNARFLPFSILESHFLTSAMSKFIATKSIFKSLARRY